MPMMRATEKARLVFAVLSPVFLVLCAVAIHADQAREWTRYQEDFARLFADKAAGKLAEAKAGGNALETARWERIVGEVSGLKPEIKQIYVQSLGVTDRCTTCHLGIDDPLFADAPQPLRTHSGKLLQSHEVNRFGCTVCHDGQGSSTTVEAGHGREDNWLKPLLPATLVQSTCARCHAAPHGLAGAERVNAGGELFLSKGCYGCHDAAGVEYLPKFAPPLSDLASKLRDPATWTRAWIKQPTTVAPDTIMPDFKLTDQQTGDISAFLLSLSKAPPAAAAAPAADAASVADGKRLFTERGCRGCHAVDEGEHSVSTRVPHLGDIGSKVTPAWLDQWIADPKKYNPATAMPVVALGDDERKSVVAYLLTLERKQPLAAPAAGKFDAAAGKELVKTYECFGCHAIKGFEDARPAVPNLAEFARRPVAELDFGKVPDLPRTKWDWLRHKLIEPHAYESEKITLRMPTPSLTDDEREAIVAFTIGLAPAALPGDYARPATPAQKAATTADWMLTRFNCNGCHPLRGKAAHIATFFDRQSRVAPMLDGVGARLQGQYLYDFLMEPKSVRPWLTMRMPTFGFEQQDARRLVEGLAALAGTTDPYTYVAKTGIDQEHFDRGARRFGYYKCIQCHPSSIDQGLPEGLSPDDLSINLMLSKDRLRPEWLAEFLARPKQISGNETRMPTVFYSVEGAPKVDKPDADIADIVTYIMGMKEDAETTMKAFQAELQAEQQKTEVDWSNMKY